MVERFPSGPSARPETHLFPRISGPPQVGPERSRARGKGVLAHWHNRHFIGLSPFRQHPLLGAVPSLPAGINENESDPSGAEYEVCNSVPLFGVTCPPPLLRGVALVPLFFSRSARAGRFTWDNHSGMREICEIRCATPIIRKLQHPPSNPVANNMRPPVALKTADLRSLSSDLIRA